MTVSVPDKRISSLDTLRSLAILLVMIRHYTDFITYKNNFGVFSQIGWIGVDLFFVLSGYLISSHVFAALKLDNFSLTKFYIKRFFKTLPNYYFVLALYFLVPGFSEKPILVPLWRFLIFIQNFNLPSSGFAQSWSLCVEEQFYLIFPFLALWICKKNHKHFLYMLIGIILVGIFIRGMLWYHLKITNTLNFENYKMTIYYPTYCRLDGFIGGIILSYIQNYYIKVWEKITSCQNWFLWVGIIIIMSCIVIVAKRNPFLNSTIIYPGLSLGFSMIVIAAFSADSLLTKFKSRLLGNLAKWSYAIYLIQKPLSVICASYFTQFGLDNNSYLIIFISFTIQIIAGYIIYTLIEQQLLPVRNRILQNMKN